MTPRTTATPSRRPRARWTLAPAVATTLLLALVTSGCTIETVDGTPPKSPSTASEPTRPSSTPDAQEITSPDDSVDDSPDGAGPASPAPGAATVTCPDGALVLWRAGQSVTLTDDCDTVTISAADVQLTARSITTLEIEAAGSVVHATAIESLVVAGAGNTVVWDEGSPIVDDSGADNVLVRAR